MEREAVGMPATTRSFKVHNSRSICRHRKENSTTPAAPQFDVYYLQWDPPVRPLESFIFQTV